jgi:peptidoglycan/LPS O-acetylase OafA/YrhL
MTTEKALSAILALLVATAGWYYMFYSRAAQRLGGVEGAAANLQRVRLRRINGFVMFLLAICLFAGVWTYDSHKAPGPYLLVWVVAFVLLLVIVVLALLDLRLTAKLRRTARPEPPRTTL